MHISCSNSRIITSVSKALDCKEDYNEYMAESTVVPTEETTDSPIA